MKKSQLYELISDAGWIKVDDTDTFFVFDLGDRTAKISPALRRSGVSQYVELNEKLAVKEFDDAIRRITGEDSQIFRALKKRRPPTKLTTVNLKKATLEGELAQIVTWARGLEIVEELERFAGYSTSVSSGAAIAHLAALALLGQRNQLECYLDSFESGEDLGFVPYVTKDKLARCLEIEPLPTG